MLSNTKEMSEPQMDVVQMNNLIVNLRATTKKAMHQVCQKLNKTVRTLQAKKDDKTNDKKQKRAAKLIEEMKILKSLQLDDVTKFSLTYNGSKPNNIKDVALSRIAGHKLLTEKSKSLREQYKDWESLVYFITNRVTRRPKKKSFKVKPKRDIVKREAPINKRVVTEPTVCKNVTVAETLDKLKGLGGPVVAFNVDEDDLKQMIAEVPDQDVDSGGVEAINPKRRNGFFFKGDDEEEVEEENLNKGRPSKFHHYEKKKQGSGPVPRFQNKVDNTGRGKFVAGKKDKTPQEQLHPSWEAKKREKERIKQVTQKSTKIVYDD